jgi:hypothetical protein
MACRGENTNGGTSLLTVGISPSLVNGTTRRVLNLDQ